MFTEIKNVNRQITLAHDTGTKKNIDFVKDRIQLTKS